MTEYHPLTWLFSIRNPGSRLAQSRLDYEIMYKSGKINKNASKLTTFKTVKICTQKLCQIMKHPKTKMKTENKKQKSTINKL